MAGVSDITIERSVGKLRIWIYTARPGIVIGRGGQEINSVREEVSKLTGSEVFLDIKEVKVPQIDAQLVSENIALQLEKRVAFRKAMKKALSSAMSRGAGGVKIRCKGRLGGSEIARTEGYKQGKVPLGTFRANVTYGFSEAFTTYGTIGVKVWIYLGDVLVKREEAERVKKLEKRHLQKVEAQQVLADKAKQTVPSDHVDLISPHATSESAKESLTVHELPGEPKGTA